MTARQDSPIIGLKKFNNWTKSVLISKFAHAAAPPGSGGGGRRAGIKVLDIGCGKGGDLPKWAKANTDEYIGIGQWNTQSGPHMSTGNGAAYSVPVG